MNAKRPSIPAEAAKVPPAMNTNSGKQPHDNMAPFTPAPVQQVNEGSYGKSSAKLPGPLMNEGTGRC